MLSRIEQRKLVRENARLRKKLQLMVYGDTRRPDTRMSRAPDGGAALSESEIDYLHMMQRQGAL